MNVGQGLAILEFDEFDTEGCNYDYLTVSFQRTASRNIERSVECSLYFVVTFILFCSIFCVYVILFANLYEQK